MKSYKHSTDRIVWGKSEFMRGVNASIMAMKVLITMQALGDLQPLKVLTIPNLGTQLCWKVRELSVSVQFNRFLRNFIYATPRSKICFIIPFSWPDTGPCLSTKDLLHYVNNDENNLKIFMMNCGFMHMTLKLRSSLHSGRLKTLLDRKNHDIVAEISSRCWQFLFDHDGILDH